MTNTKHKLLKLVNFILIIIVTMIIGIIVWHLNNVTAYTGTDLLNHFIVAKSNWPSAKTHTINNIVQLVKSVYNHTIFYNGYFTSQFISQLFMQFPKAWFNIINTLMFIILCFLICFTVFSWKKITWFYLLIVFFILFYFSPSWGQNVLNLSGAPSALWATVIFLLYLLPFRWDYVPKFYKLFNIGMIILGIFLGGCNDLIGIIAIFMAYLCFRRNTIKSNKSYQYLSIWACILSSFLMTVHSFQALHFNLSYKLLRLLEDNLILTIILIVSSLVFLKFYIKYNNILNKMIILGLLMNLLFIVFVNNLNYYEFFEFSILLVIGILNVLYYSIINIPRKFIFIGSPVVMIILIFITINLFNNFYYIDTSLTRYYECFNTARLICNRTKSIKQNCIVPAMPKVTTNYSVYFYSGYLSDHPNDWFNMWFAKYYKVKSVKTSEKIKIIYN